MGKLHEAADLTELVCSVAGYSRGMWANTVPHAPPKGEHIERRAYELWQRAGFPKGKDKEFKQRAEKDLREEKIRAAEEVGGLQQREPDGAT